MQQVNNITTGKKDVDNVVQILKIISFLLQKPLEAQQNKVQIMNEILRLMKNIIDLKETNKTLFQQQISVLTTEEIVKWCKDHLNDPKPQVRYNAIKFLRYLIEDKNILIMYRQKGIHYFIARSLEREQKATEKAPANNNNQNNAASNQVHQEILQALKFIHRWLEVYAVKFPKVLGNALVGFAESCNDMLKRYAIITLRIFALNAPDICGWCGGIRLLIEAATDPLLADISDQIVWSLLYLLNEPSARQTVRVYLDLSKWFSIFTEIDPPIDQKQDKQRAQTNKFEAQLNLSKKALISVLKSWQGLIYLGNERQALRSIIQALRQPIKPVIRGAIYDVLKELLALGNKENSGVAVVNRSSEAGHWALGEFKINNLLNNYLVMLIQMLLDCDLFKILVELSGLEDNEVAQPAQRFLKELSALMFNLIPDCHRYTDFLISAANQNDPFLVDLKSWSSEIVNTMGNYAFDQEKKKKHQVSKFLYQCENLYLTTQLGLPSHKINNETIGIIRGQIEQEADENKFQSLIKQSMVSQQKDDFNRWNWESILELLETFLNNQNRFHEAIKNKFLKTLLNYYLPSNMYFVYVDWRPENFIQAKCGYLLLKLLIKDRKGRDLLTQSGEGYFKISKSYIADLISLLKADIQTLYPTRNSVPNLRNDSDDGSSMVHSANFTSLNQRDSSQGQRITHPALSLLSPDLYSTKMMREYMSWLGLLTSSKHGQIMFQQPDVFSMLMQWVDRAGRRDHILIHLIHSFDYGKQGKAREFFQFCLQQGSKTLIKACIEFLRLLYRTELHDFSQWAVELLVKALEHPEEDIGLKALNVIEEVTYDADIMSRFIEKVNLPKLLALSQRSGSQFMITMLSNRKGFERMYREQQEVLLAELERWKEEESLKYIEKVEKVMCDALEFIQGEENAIQYKFPLLLSNTENSQTALQFIHKMPWMMYVNFESPDYEGTIPYIASIDSYSNSKFTLLGKPYYNNDYLIDKTLINSNHQFIMKLYISVGKVFIDNLCKEVNETYQVRCDSNDKRHIGVIRNGQLIIEKNGIQFFFDEEPHHKLRLSQIKVSFRMGESKNNTIKMPAHIFGELSYTEQGFKLLRDQNYIEYFVSQIRNDNAPVQQKRSALWAIGQIGQSKNGVRLIRDMELIPDLVRMAEQYPVLSLRGTCLYTLNMICTTNTGRKELEKFQWISHMNSHLGWLCIPKNIYQFFYIRIQAREGQKSFWPLQEEIWEKYTIVQKSIKLNEDQTHLLESIALMSNGLTQRDADREINKLKQTKPELFESMEVLHSLLLMLTFYRFRTAAKNKIYQYFEKVFTPKNVSRLMESQVYQQIGYQDGTIV